MHGWWASQRFEQNFHSEFRAFCFWFSLFWDFFSILIAVVVSNCALWSFRTEKLYDFLSDFNPLYLSLKSLTTTYSWAKTCKSRKCDQCFPFFCIIPLENLLTFDHFTFPCPQEFFSFLRQSLPLSSRLECCGTIFTHCSLWLQGSNDSASPSQVVGITSVHHRVWLIFVFLVEMGFHHVGQCGLELLTSSDPPISASQSAGIRGVRHHTCPI